MTARQRGWILPPSALMLFAGVFIGREVSGLFWPFFACVLALVSILLLKGMGRFFACIVFSLTLGFCAGSVAFHPVLPPEGEYTVRAVVSDEVSSGSFGQVRVYLSDIALDDRPFGGGAYWTFYSDTDQPDLLPVFIPSRRFSDSVRRYPEDSGMSGRSPDRNPPQKRPEYQSTGNPLSGP